MTKSLLLVLVSLLVLVDDGCCPVRPLPAQPVSGFVGR